MSQENHPKPLKVLWEQLLGEDVSHLQGCFAENEENKALFHGLPHKMIVLGNVLTFYFQDRAEYRWARAAQQAARERAPAAPPAPEGTDLGSLVTGLEFQHGKDAEAAVPAF